MSNEPRGNDVLSVVSVVGVGSPTLAGEERCREGWELWREGNIPEALQAADALLAKQPADQDALHLRTLVLFVQGSYAQAFETFSRIRPEYEKKAELGKVLISAYYHLNKPDAALALAKVSKVEDLAFAEARATKPLSVKGERTCMIPFVGNKRVPVQFWPGVAAKVNGQELTIMFDTGGPFLIMGKERADALGIQLIGSGTPGKVDTRDVTLWGGIADRVEMGDGLVLENVPASIVPKLEWIIFGTNILEQFLTTVDYPNSRLILTPRTRPDLFPTHRGMLSSRQVKMPFYLWGDHYMFGKGIFGDHGGLNFFFDSGLIAITGINGKIVQAPFTASQERLIAWGFPEADLTANRYFETRRPLGIPGLLQEDTVLYFGAGLKRDRVFGGVRIDGLISHAWLSKYSWTIDFDTREYSFGLRQSGE